MFKRNKHTNQIPPAAFTLIELLVVISIIGVLASVALVAVNTARQKAYVAKLSADAHQIETGLDLVRNTQNKSMGQITGNWCNACEFGTTLRVLDQPTALAHNDSAWISLGFTAGAPRDPWGNPYVLDENEYEPSQPCGRFDQVLSVGPDGINESAPFAYLTIPAPGQIYSYADDHFFNVSLALCTVPAIP